MAKYLSNFRFPSADEQDNYLFKNRVNFGYYPFRVLRENPLEYIDFEDITIFYGGNGSGKSTALNIIAEKLNINRHSVFAKTKYYDDFLSMCEFEISKAIPEHSRIITSDDVFDFMLDMRTLNSGITETRKEKQAEYLDARYGNFKFRTMDDYEQLKKVNKARSKSKSGFVNGEVMKNVEIGSNGENAFQYFVEKIGENALYILDEPENSLSPKKQLELKNFLEDAARFFGCQFIISTHSPFLLSMENARIYDMDSDPVTVKKWTELENVRTYYSFFMQNISEFKE